jgi:hypothetical protein
MFYEMLTSLATSLKLQRRLVVIIKHVECGSYHDKHQKTHQLFVVLDIGQTVTQLVHKECQFPKIHLFWPPVCGYHDVFHHLSHFFSICALHTRDLKFFCALCYRMFNACPFWMKFIHHHLFLSIMS